MLLKRVIETLALLLFSGVALAAPQSLQVAGNQVRIAVMGQDDFHPDRAVPGTIRSLPDDLAARIIEQLNATRRFSVVERTALRRVLREQEFGREQTPSDLDRVIEQTVDKLPSVNGWTVAAASAAADHNDRLKEFRDLGGTVGADYIVYAVLEKHRGSSKTTAVPFSARGRETSTRQVDARLRLRVIETSQGRIIGADSIRTRISEAVFSGREARNDEYTMFDQLGREAASRVLDIVFPVRLVASDPWVINRGSDQRVSVGDSYEIVREGQEIRDDAGIVIGRLRAPVGQARVVQVQDTLAVLDRLSGDWMLNDLAIRQPAAEQAAPAAAPVAGAGTTGKRPRLAVGLVKARSTASSGSGSGAEAHIPAFTDALISRLAQTRRFQLIDRQEVDQLLDEQLAQAMAENRDLPSSMGALAGADYLLIGSIAQFSIERITTRLPGSSRTLLTDQGRIEGNMRIVDARSGDVLDSRKVSIVEQLSEPSGAAQLISDLADAYAEQAVLNLMNAIYPIKVAAVVSGVVYINRGTDGGLSPGEVLVAMRPGQAIIDPDTGVQLGVAETELGELTLAGVEDARSTAPLGRLQLQTGDVLKRHAAVREKRSSAVSERRQPQQRSGGRIGHLETGPLMLAVGQLRINPRGRNRALSGANLGRVSNDMMVKLSQFPGFVVMERVEIDQLIDEQAFSALAQGGSLPGVMRELEGADYLVIATIDDFLIRSEGDRVNAVGERQARHFGTVESTLRMIDVHTGRLVAADKLRLSERVSEAGDEGGAMADLLDLYTSELAYRISDNLSARTRGQDTRPPRPLLDADRPGPVVPAVRRPGF